LLLLSPANCQASTTSSPSLGSDDMRSQFAPMAGVGAGHLLFSQDRVAEESVGCGGHGGLAPDFASFRYATMLAVDSRNLASVGDSHVE
jgi:hypothetical protein